MKDSLSDVSCDVLNIFDGLTYEIRSLTQLAIAFVDDSIGVVTS